MLEHTGISPFLKLYSSPFCRNQSELETKMQVTLKWPHAVLYVLYQQLYLSSGPKRSCKNKFVILLENLLLPWWQKQFFYACTHLQTRQLPCNQWQDANLLVAKARCVCAKSSIRSYLAIVPSIVVPTSCRLVNIAWTIMFHRSLMQGPPPDNYKLLMHAFA